MSANRTAPAAAAAALLLSAAASLAPAAPLLAAVSLSISDTNGYRYVSIPTNMAASLTGQGMGATAPTEDCPLRYEDAAFLAEALAERRELFGSLASGYDIPGTLSERLALPIGTTLYDAYYFGVSDKPYFHRPSGFGDPDAEMWDGIRNYDSSPDWATGAEVNYLPAWAAIFGKTNWIELVDMDGEDVTNRTLRAEYVARLYDYVSRATRPAISGSLRSFAKVSHCYWKDIDNTQWASYGYPAGSSNKAWVYGERDATNEVTFTELDNGTAVFGFGETVNYRAERKKARGWELVTDDKGNSEWEDVTGERDFYSTKMSKSSNRSMPILFMPYPFPSSCAIPNLGERSVTGGYLYATGSFSYYLKVAGEVKKNIEKEFVMRVPAKVYNNVTYGITCEPDIGLPNRNDAVVSDVCGHFGVTAYPDAEAFLAVVPDPETTSANHDDYAENSKSGEYSLKVHLSQFYAVYDIDFNARVKDGGE